MADLDLKKVVAAAESAVADIKDPELKRPAFEKILERLLAEGKAATGRAASKRLAKSQQPESEEGAEDETRDEFFGAHDHEDPSDNVRLIAAYLYREYGTAAFTVRELEALADDIGLTVPARVDMTLRSAKDGGKRLFSSPARRMFKPTVHGEAYLKRTYTVRKGRKPKPAAKGENAK